MSQRIVTATAIVAGGAAWLPDGSLARVIRALDLADRAVAERLLTIQHAASAVEAELIGFDGIPPLQEDLAGLMASTEHWLGQYDAAVLVRAVRRDRQHHDRFRSTDHPVPTPA